MIEMLFIDSDSRGRGYGSSLIEFTKERGATKVDVYEQNPAALAFYQAKGFRIMSRNNTDEAGRLYPIIHLSLYNGNRTLLVVCRFRREKPALMPHIDTVSRRFILCKIMPVGQSN